MTADLILKMVVTVYGLYVMAIILLASVSFVYFFIRNNSSNYIEEFLDFFGEHLFQPSVWFLMIGMGVLSIALFTIGLLKMWGL